ncbi:MAG: diguanylate cyclase [Candidatus Rifleibacteriota bacterium]
MRKILIILFILTVCLPMIIAFTFASDFTRSKIEAMMRDRVENRYNIAQNLLEQQFNEIKLKAGIISQQRNVRKAVATKDLIELIDLLSQLRIDLGLNNFTSGLEIYEPEGKLLTAEPRKPFFYATNDFIREIIKGNHSDIRFFKNNQLVAMAGIPIYVENQAGPAAALVLYFIIDETFVDHLKKLVNAEIIISAEVENSNFAVAVTPSQNNRRSFPTLSNLDQKISEVTTQRQQFVVRTNKFKADNGNFYLGVALSKKHLILILKSLKDIFFKTGAIAIIFAFFTALILSQIIITPLQKLVKAARNFGEGRLAEKQDFETNIPELKFLGNSFNLMFKQIRTKIEEIDNARKSLDRKVFDLSVRNLINQAIINKSENSVLEELLHIVVDTIGSERSSMLILEEATQKFKLKVAYMRNQTDKSASDLANQPGSICFDIGEGFAGYAARHKCPVFSNDPQNDSRFKNISDSHGIKNLISVPLTDEGKVIGILNVSDREEDFTQEDAQLLEAIAEQISIALQKARLYEMAITDGLTGLFIHRYFQMRLESEIARAMRGDESLSLIMFDIDHFKNFNDTHGHQVGDLVLKQVAATVKHNVREGIDIAARYGGEEFAIIMPETDINGASTFAERLRKSIKEKFIEHENQKLKVTISLGCAEFPKHAQNRELLISCADTALYKSKENGRNTVSIP